MVNQQWPCTPVPPMHDNDHRQGFPYSKIQLMEYGNYPCIHSSQAYLAVKDIQSNVGDQLCFIYRHFPSTDTSAGWKASEAAEAAGSQGKFWEMHQTLFEHHTTLNDGDLVEYANQIDLDVPQFLREMATHLHRDRIQADKNEGLKIGVKLTPTFFISIRHQGPQTLNALIQRILEAINAS